MPFHNETFTSTVEADRRTRAATRWLPADAAGLERFLMASDRPADAWPAFVERLSARTRAVARAHRLSPHDTDDVVQTAWLRLLEHGHHIREPAAVEGWVHTTARRESLRMLRETARTRPTDPQIFAERPDEDARGPERDEAAWRDALGQAITHLPERQRQLVRLLTREPTPSYAEIASALDMPVGSIGPTRQRCLDRLRQDARIAALATATD
jgi:RNA polymerase sigma factor (sigma-70 family)